MKTGIAVEVFWGAEWVRPIEAYRLGRDDIMAVVIDRHGKAVNVKFCNPRKRNVPRWRLFAPTPEARHE